MNFDDGRFASGLNGGSHPGGSTAAVAGIPTLIRSAFRDRSTRLAWETSSGWPMRPDWDDAAVRCADPCFGAGLSGQQPRPTHPFSANVRCGFTLSAIAVPVPAIMANATTQPAIIFMAQSSWAATLRPFLAASCDR